MKLETERELPQPDAETQVLMRNAPRSRNSLVITTRISDGVTILDTGHVEIWDGADLYLLRDALYQLIVEENRRLIGLDIMHVKHLPTGFFGMLFDWHEKGISIRLYFPQPHIQNMLWFRQFFFREDTPGVEDPPAATEFRIPPQVDQTDRCWSLQLRSFDHPEPQYEHLSFEHPEPLVPDPCGLDSRDVLSIEDETAVLATFEERLSSGKAVTWAEVQQALSVYTGNRVSRRTTKRTLYRNGWRPLSEGPHTTWTKMFPLPPASA